MRKPTEIPRRFKKTPPAAEHLQTLCFYKPYGVISQFTEEGGHPSLKGFGFPAGVYPVGRLDHDSEGLLVLTNDPRLVPLLADPRHRHPRTYWAQVEGAPTAEDLEKLAKGPRLSDGQTRPCKVRALDVEPSVPPRDPPIRFRAHIPTTWVELILTEGRNRQVRRMTAAVGFPTLRLLRVAVGPWTLEGLEPGKWRPAKLAEVREIFDGMHKVPEEPGEEPFFPRKKGRDYRQKAFKKDFKKGAPQGAQPGSKGKEAQGPGFKPKEFPKRDFKKGGFKKGGFKKGPSSSGRTPFRGRR